MGKTTVKSSAVKVLKRLKSTPARIGVSSLHGVGLIAVRRIAKGEKMWAEGRGHPTDAMKDRDGVKFCEVDECLIDKMELDSSTRPLAGMVRAYFDTIENEKRKKVIVMPVTGMDRPHPVWYLNASKAQQNVRYLDINDHHGGGLVALRNINPGEELLGNYAELDDPNHPSGAGEDEVFKSFPDDKAWAKQRKVVDKMRLAYRRQSLKAALAQKHLSKAEELLHTIANKARNKK